MKRFASLALLIFAAASVALAEDQTPQQKQQKARRHTGNGSNPAARNAEISRRVTSQPNFQRKFNTAPQSTYNAQRIHRTPAIGSNLNRQINVNRNRQLNSRIYEGGNGQSNLGNAGVGVRGGHNWQGNGQNANSQRNSQNGNRSGNWKANHARWSQYRNWEKTRRDRSWWRSHYNRFALFGGGYYYYNSGFWYPAYGYDPYFSTYSYEAPIYAYNDQDPGQVIANVQTELSRRGYDSGAVDGTYGPATRNALLNFQADNGLPESGEIDEATLDALGLQ